VIRFGEKGGCNFEVSFEGTTVFNKWDEGGLPRVAKRGGDKWGATMDKLPFHRSEGWGDCVMLLQCVGGGQKFLERWGQKTRLGEGELFLI